MYITRENRVKVLQNIGQYLIDHADDIIPPDGNKTAYKQTLTIEMSAISEVPRMAVDTQYLATETFRGIKWSATARW